jgi:hypothetical protein
VDYRLRDQNSPKNINYKRCRKRMPIIEINSYILMSLAEIEIPCRQIYYNCGRDRERRKGKRKIGGLQNPYTARSLYLSAFQ